MLDIQGRKYAAVTVCDVTLYDINTNYPVMFFDTLQLTSIDSSVETTDIQGGRGNATLASISHTKTIDVQFDDAIMTMSSLALLTGGKLSKTDDKVATSITMPKTALLEVEGTGSGLYINIVDEDNKAMTVKDGSYVWIAKMVNGVLSTATRSEEPVTLSDNKLTLDLFHNIGTIAAGDKVRVFYEHEIAANSTDELASELKVLDDAFAGSYRFIGDTVLFNQHNGENEIFQIEIPNLKLDSSYSMSFQAATEAIVFSFKGKALRNDEKEMIIFRQVEKSGSGEEGILGEAADGSYKAIPYHDVKIKTDKTIDCNEDVSA